MEGLLEEARTEIDSETKDRSRVIGVVIPGYGAGVGWVLLAAVPAAFAELRLRRRRCRRCYCRGAEQGPGHRPRDRGQAS
jgi:hypothetical protein